MTVSLGKVSLFVCCCLFFSFLGGGGGWGEGGCKFKNLGETEGKGVLVVVELLVAHCQKRGAGNLWPS